MIPLGFEPKTQQRFGCCSRTTKSHPKKDGLYLWRVIPLGFEPKTQQRFGCCCRTTKKATQKGWLIFVTSDSVGVRTKTQQRFGCCSRTYWKPLTSLSAKQSFAIEDWTLNIEKWSAKRFKYLLPSLVWMHQLCWQHPLGQWPYVPSFNFTWG